MLKESVFLLFKIHYELVYIVKIKENQNQGQQLRLLFIKKQVQNVHDLQIGKVIPSHSFQFLWSAPAIVSHYPKKSNL